MLTNRSPIIGSFNRCSMKYETILLLLIRTSKFGEDPCKKREIKSVMHLYKVYNLTIFNISNLLVWSCAISCP